MMRPVLFAISVFVIGALTASFFLADTSVTYVTFSSGTTVRIEVADDPSERVRGLSGREELSEGSGMLFVFEEPQEVGIWMKDMKFSIDILWIRDGQVVWIVENAPVPDWEEVASYLPPVVATHVLELPAGFVASHDVRVGQALTMGR